MRVLASICVAASVIALVSCEEDELVAEQGRQEQEVRAKRDVLARLNEQLLPDGDERVRKLDQASARLAELEQRKAVIGGDLAEAGEGLEKARAELAAARDELAAFRNEFRIHKGE